MQNEKLRYQPNKKSQLFIMLAMVLMVIALFLVINIFRFSRNEVPERFIAPNIFLGIEILVAIFAMLLSFLLGEKFKTYDEAWLKVGVGLTIYPLIKIFLYPISLFNRMKQIISLGYPLKQDPLIWFISVLVLLILSSTFYFIGTFINYQKVKALKEYYKEVGIDDAK